MVDRIHRGDKFTCCSQVEVSCDKTNEFVSTDWPKFLMVGGKSSYLRVYKDN